MGKDTARVMKTLGRVMESLRLRSIRSQRYQSVGLVLTQGRPGLVKSWVGCGCGCATITITILASLPASIDTVVGTRMGHSALCIYESFVGMRVLM